MAKYPTDPSNHTTAVWDRDTDHVLYQWKSKPFHGVRHRHETVEQRIRIEYHDGVGADIRREARSEDTAKFPDEWGLVEAVELREHGARHTRHARARYLDD